MASNTAAAPPLSELSGVIEELRRQLASANDAQLASEVGHQHQTVLSNIMLTSQEAGQVAPPEDVEKAGSGVAKATAFSPVSNFKNGTNHETSTDPQTAPPTSAPDQISAAPDLVGHHNLTPFDHQASAPDVHLAHAVQLAAATPSYAGQFSPQGGGEPRTVDVDINDAPTVGAAIAGQSASEDAGFSFTVPQASFTDVDVGDTLTLSASLADGSPLPSWLSFDPASSTFSGTPLNGDVGSLSLRVTATDTSGATASQDFTVSVANTNDGPVASAAIAGQSASEDAGFSFTVPQASFTDVDVGDTLTLSASLADGSPLPSWLSFDPASSTFSGTPLNGDVGSLSLRVTATDTSGATASQDFTVSVANTNDGPVASAAIAGQSASEDAGFSFTVPQASFTDVDVGDTLTLSASLADGSPLPSWLSFDPASSTFSGTPLNGDVGSLSLRVTATDTSGATASQDFTVSVANTNDGPVASAAIAGQSASEDAGFSFTVPQASFTDVDVGDTLTLSASLADGSPLPSWLSFDPASSTFSGTPLNGDVGSLSLRVTATDTSGATASQDFTVSVANTNDGPVASAAIAGQSASEDAGFSFTVPQASFTDVDVGDTLTLSASLADGSPLPSWLSFDPASSTFSGTPLNGDVGSLSLRVTATDTSGATASQDFTVSVANTNDGPVASAAIAGQSASEDAGFSFTVPQASFTDVDVGDTLTLSASLADGSPLPSWLSFDPASSTFSGTPLNGDVGSLSLRVTATDTSGATASQDFTVSVANTNDGPVASAAIAGQSASEDAGFSFTVPQASFTDVDVGDTLTLSASLADGSPLPSWLSFDPASSTFSGTPLNGDVGSLSLRVTATDTSGATASQDFTVSVANTNDGPVASAAIAGQSASEDAGFSFTVPQASFTDVDVGDTLTLSASLADGSPLPSWLSFDPASSTFSGTPLNGDVGSLSLRVTATDTSGATASQDFTVSVANTNDGPVASAAIAGQSASEDAGFSFTVPQASFTDVDVGDTLTLSASLADGSPLPSWLSFDPASSTFSGTPLNGDVGSLSLRVTATDTSGATASQDFTVSVANTNDGPVASAAIAGQSASEDAGFSFTVPQASFTDVDVGDTLTLSASLADGSPLPSWLSFDPATSTFSGTPLNGDVGSLSLRVTATDTSGATASQDFTVSVANTNDAPEITSSNAASFAENASGTVYTATATDPDAGTTLTYSISGADAALFNINATTGAITFKSSPNYEAPADAGGNNVYDITVGASDGAITTSKAVAITVTNVNEAPTITSGATASFAENGAGTVYTAAATDPDAGTTLIYSISGTDAALFNIDSVTGLVTFKSSPNYEAPTDTGGNNVYDVKVTASDGALSSTKDVAITVTNVDEAPTITSGATASFAENGTGTVYTAAATDPDAGTTLTYSLTGTDAALFNINATTGAVTFKSSPNYEAPTDTGANNVYDVTVRASDGTNITTKAVAITVTNVNEAPTITSGAAASFAENSTGTVYTVAASDQDAGTTLTYSLTGTDAALFNINATTGAVTFKSSPNYEAPADAGGNNVYDVNVTASDGTNSATKAVAISVTNVNEAPTVTSAATASFAENASGTVYTATATDPDAGTTLTYSISGADAALFNINATTGAITFKSSPNYEAPTDAGGNNVYDITVGASDGAITTSKAVAITVTNVNEAPTITSGAAASFAENAAGTVYTAAATDPDAGATLTYSISGTDASLFNINATTGAVTFKSAPNYGAPGDAGGNNVYDVKVTASDGALSSTKDVAITVTNVNEAPTITSGATASFAENGAGTVYTAAATDPDAGTTLTYSISGADAALFDINATTGAVTFKSSPNYEAPGDTGGNNVYDVKVTASDGALSSTKDVAITVTNVNEAPVITSGATASFAENASGTVYTATATDPDASTTLTYSISGADAALFNINATTGAVTFKSSPNYEAPGDASANNVYDVKVTASDGALSSTKDVAITVTNVNEAPTITSGAAASFAENAAGTVYTAAATDPDAGATLTYSISGTDAALFNIDSVTGVVTFKSSPNYEAPTDTGGNNVYDVNVTASDGANSATKAVAITVTNVNEAPTVTSAATASFAENASGTVYTAAGTDPDAGTTLAYSISGTDAALFDINATTGAVTFKSSPNYEAPGDAGGNNVYDVSVTASDGTNSASKAVAITVTNVNEAPTVTSAATASFAENASGTVYTAAGTDPDAGTTLSYTISGADAALFNINAATGAVTFKSSPNYEAPTDTGGNNVYDVNVTASDGTNSATKAVAITVTNVNEAPTITSGAAASFAENGTGTVYTAAATDPDAGTTLTYSISGADAALFNINAATGAVTFKSSPNYEAPTDTGGNNVYDVNVTASDGTNSATKAVAITVTNANDAPVITSSNAASFAENATGTVYTVAASDQDAGTTLTYSLTGTDAALFNINATTGAVTFKSSPNYEAPGDAGANNVYDLTVRASDGTTTTSQAVAITVTNVNEAPTVTSAATANFAENGTGTVYTAAATDPDAGTTLTYSISGADAALFDINAATGAVTFKSSPNYEAPGDAGGNNVYDVNVTASDGTNSASKAVAITVTNVNEAPTVTSAATASFAENATGTVYTVAATDPDAGATLTYSLIGTDAALFNINATTGAVTFKSSPNYEAPGDAGANNVYDVTVRASDGTNIATKAVAITVTNVNEAPVITSGATASFAENGTGTVYTAAATDPDAGTTLTYSISGTDAALFDINATTGAVTFKSAPNYEVPTDAGTNNVYNITVGTSDGTNTASKAVAVTVTNVTNEAPVFTSAATASFAENATGTVYSAAAIPDSGKTLTYSLAGADAARFNINATTGAVTFKSSPNYEAPTDAGANNVYDVNVTASDGTNSATKAVAITVTNVNEAPVITSGTTASFAENGAGTVYTVAATDPDAGTTLTYSLSGTDSSLFNINATTGAVTFKSAPNYEAPTDAGGNNVYNVTVGTSDGTNSATKAVAITVTNVSEAPTGITVTGPLSVQETVVSGGGIGTAYNPGALQPVIATLSASDPDAGDTATYSLVGAPAGLFTISGNQIKVASGASFDYETTPSYALTVRATDSTGQTFDQVVNINIANYAGSYTGTGGNDTAIGTSEEDTISGGAGNDTLDGGNGDDLLTGGSGADVLTGGAGFDTVNYATATAGVALSFAAMDGNGIGGQYVNAAAGGYTGDATGDSFSGIETFIGTSFADVVGGGSTAMTFSLGAGNDTFDTNAAYNVDDVVYGGDGNDTMWTGGGNDSLYGGAGDDLLYGETGTDTAFYSDATSGVTVSLATTAAQNTGGAGIDTLNTIENLYGSGFADTLTGNSGDNSIWGDAGNDALYGGAGNDTLYGGAGVDTMYGEAGADLFFLQAGLGNDTAVGGAAGSWIDALDLHDASGNSYSGAFPNDWTLFLTSGSITSTGSESLTLSTDSSGYVQHTDGTQVNFTEIEQIRW